MPRLIADDEWTYTHINKVDKSGRGAVLVVLRGYIHTDWKDNSTHIYLPLVDKTLVERCIDTKGQ